MLYPEQFDPTKPFELIADKVPSKSGQSLAERVAAKLAREDQLITDFGPQILGATLQQELSAMWHDREEITVGELWGYFTRYIYMPRLVSRSVLDTAVCNSLGAVLVAEEQFGIARAKDKDSGRYRDLLLPPQQGISIQVTDSTLLVEANKTLAQIEADQKLASEISVPSDGADDGPNPLGASVPAAYQFGTPNAEPHSGTRGGLSSESPVEDALIRYFGSVKVDPERYARDLGNVMREVIDHLAGAGAELEITVDIQASKPDGFDKSVIRTVLENASVLKFDVDSGFER